MKESQDSGNAQSSIESTQVNGYDDIQTRDVDLSGREKSRIAQILSENGGPVLALAEWLVDEKSITPVDGMWKLYAVSVLSESEKAWRVETGVDREWVPKSQAELFELADGVGEIATPDTSLADFGGQK